MDLRGAWDALVGRQRAEEQRDPWARLVTKLSGGFPGVAWVPSTFVPEAALRLPAVSGAINTIARSVAALPLKVYDGGSGDEIDPDADMEANIVSARWTPYSHTAADGLYHWLRAVLLHGSGGVLVERAGTEPDSMLLALRPVNPVGLDRRLAPGVQGAGAEVTYHVQDPFGGDRRVQRSEIMFLPFVPPFDGYTDKSPLQDPWSAIRAGLEAQEWSASYFQKGAQPDTYLMSGDADAGTFETNLALIQKQFDEMRAGKRREMMLPDGWQVKTGAGASVKDADMVQARTLAVQEVGRIYDVSPLELKDLSRATYSNFEQASANDAKTAAWWAGRVQAQMNALLWPLGQRRLEFDTSELDEIVFLNRITAYRMAIEAGVLTRNQVRVKIGEPEAEQDGMDTYQIGPLAGPTVQIGEPARAEPARNGDRLLAGAR